MMIDSKLYFSQFIIIDENWETTFHKIGGGVGGEP